MSARALLRSFVIVHLGTALAFARASAQDDPLARVESLAEAGRFTDARAQLDAWKTAHPAGSNDVSASVRARALLLDARLATDPKAAEEAYLAVALGYPSSDLAASALLGLGQGLVASATAPANGSEAARRAAAYLLRLVTDHPGAPERIEALLWLSRAYALSGRPGQACATIEDALRSGAGDAPMIARFRGERTAACAGAKAGGAATPVPAPDAARDGRAAPRANATRPPARAAGRFAIQSAAVRDASGARDLVRRLQAAGFPARTVTVGSSTLIRVRVGVYERQEEAREAARRMRSAGFDAIVVDDARDERATGA